MKSSDSIDRLLALAQMLRSNKPFTSTIICEMLNVSSRTIKRDIRRLRSMGWTIAWDDQQCTYWLKSAPKPKII